MCKDVVKSNQFVQNYWTSEQEKIIVNTIAPGLNKDELKIFAHICSKVNLDPFSKQIYAIKRGGKMCIQTGIDGFRLIAERSGKYAPGAETKFVYEDRKLVSATAFVKKLTADGTWHSVSATAYLEEYSTRQGLWAKMPRVMLEKAAEARCLRRAFPADLSGLYTEEEMDQADIEIKNDPLINEETVKSIDEFINGYDEIRENLLKLCKVSSLSEIKESQLQACREFVKIQIKKIKEASKESIKEDTKEASAQNAKTNIEENEEIVKEDQNDC